MTALRFALFLICIALGGTIGSELKSWSGRSIVDNITALNQKVLDMEYSMSRTIQAANEEMLLYILDKIANNSEVHEAHLKALLSDHSLRVERLEKRVAQCDEVTLLEQNLSDQTLRIEKLSQQMEQNLRDQTLRIEKFSQQMEQNQRDQILRTEKLFQQLEQNQSDHILRTEKLRQQLEDVQSVLTCTGEPPSPQNGRTVDFERKNGSVVLYRCDVNFVQAENSTVRCHLGKWEGRPPLCRFFDASFILRAHYDRGTSNVTCSSEVNNQKMEFSVALDTGRSGPLPSGAKVFSRGKASVLDLSDITRGDRHGVYNCGYEKEGTRTEISFHIEEIGWLARRLVASIGDSAELNSTAPDDPSIRWFHDGRHIPSGDGRRNLIITGVKVTDAGTYEQKYPLYSISFELVVRGCRSTLFGEGCDQECPACYNGGTCHHFLGVCVCPPGFTGTNCELACGENKFGTNCSESCQGDDCRRQVFCKPYPSGCSCAPGYEGFVCDIRCDAGKFGADCKQTCRCAEGPCDPNTGACPGGCSPGWTGQSCQIPA